MAKPLTASDLKKIRTLTGLSTSEAAARVGVNRATWWRWEQGGTIPLEREAAIRAISTQPNPPNGNGVSNVGDLYVKLPRFDRAPGPGCSPTEENFGVLSLSLDFLRESLQVVPERCAVMLVNGDSMEPTVHAGEIAIVERLAPEESSCDGIYLINIDSGHSIKRLSRRPGGAIHVSSDNPKYPSFDLTKDEVNESCHILARVVAVLHRV